MPRTSFFDILILALSYYGTTNPSFRPKIDPLEASDFEAILDRAKAGDSTQESLALSNDVSASFHSSSSPSKGGVQNGSNNPPRPPVTRPPNDNHSSPASTAATTNNELLPAEGSNSPGVKDASAEGAPVPGKGALSPGGAPPDATTAPIDDVAADDVGDAGKTDADERTDGGAVDLKALAVAPIAKGTIFDAWTNKLSDADKVPAKSDGNVVAATDAATATNANATANATMNLSAEASKTSIPPNETIDVDADEKDAKEELEEETTLKAKVGRRGDTRRRMPSIASWGNRKDNDDDDDDDDEGGGRRRGVRELVSAHSCFVRLGTIFILNGSLCRLLSLIEVSNVTTKFT